jgi:hypothetical protein
MCAPHEIEYEEDLRALARLTHYAKYEGMTDLPDIDCGIYAEEPSF